MNYYRETETGNVWAFDDKQMAMVERINGGDFNDNDKKIADIFFRIAEKIRAMKKMTAQEINLHKNPPITKEQLTENAVVKKQILMTEAREKINVLQDADDLDMATEEEAASLTAWKKYRVLLNRVDTSTAPDIDWPKKPE